MGSIPHGLIPTTFLKQLFAISPAKCRDNYEENMFSMEFGGGGGGGGGLLLVSRNRLVIHCSGEMFWLLGIKLIS